MSKPWELTTPDGLPPHLEQAWEAMRARCREADAAARYAVDELNLQGFHAAAFRVKSRLDGANPEVRDE